MSEVILICGSRTWTDRKAIERVIFDLDRDTIIVHGGAKGADSLADEAARLWGLLRRVYPADWQTHGRAAGPIRNAEMLAAEQPNRVIAFRMPGESRGTDDMVRRARAAGIPVEVVTLEHAAERRDDVGRTENRSTNDARIGCFWGSGEAIPFEWSGSESLSTNDVIEPAGPDKHALAST